MHKQIIRLVGDEKEIALQGSQDANLDLLINKFEQEKKAKDENWCRANGKTQIKYFSKWLQEFHGFEEIKIITMEFPRKNLKPV